MGTKGRNISTRHIAAIVVTLLVVNASLAFWIARESAQGMGEQLQARMLDIANSAARLLDGDSLKTLEASDAGTAAYENAMAELRAFQESTELSYIYGIRERADGTFEFTVDPTEADPAGFGETVQYTEALGRAAKGTPAVDLVPYKDDWGRFYSAYAPVFDSTGNVAGIVGVDFPAAWYEGHLTRNNRIVFLTCVASLALAIVAVLAAVRFSALQQRHMESLRHIMLYDTLTGLPKMGNFFELASVAADDLQKEGQDAAILYVDLIGMRFFNQQLGFSEGDALLTAFAALFSKYFGRSRCGRMGQDHFAAITGSAGLDERLASFIDDCARLNEGRSLPVRVGVYPLSLDRVSISTACDRAKAANEANRTTQKSSITYFDHDMLAESEQRQYVVQNIDRAIAEGWIKVHYQPIVRTANGRVCDEEALARWDDPERGLLSPAAFVPALEAAKLIYKLDLNVLEQTLAKMGRLAAEGLYVVPASLNISRSDFETCDIVEEIRRRVDEAGIERSMINIEITETALGRDSEFMRRQVERLHELGFQVWMDDFGSEYSSLDYLQSLRFDLIKFDMSFMRQFDSGDKSKIILTELMKMAIGLGVDTITEGVERRDQMEFLREIGCNKLQGYYFSTPHSLEEVLERYESGTAIGFENPAEADYYSALGRISLYDLSSIARGDDEDLQHYFNILPMAIVEANDEKFRFVRCNRSYRHFAQSSFSLQIDVWKPYGEKTAVDSAFSRAIKKCMRTGERIMIDDEMFDGTYAHTLMRRVATNPVTGTCAIAMAILSVVE